MTRPSSWPRRDRLMNVRRFVAIASLILLLTTGLGCYSLAWHDGDSTGKKIARRNLIRCR